MSFTEKLVLDGAMGTELQKMGLKAGQDPCDWNVEAPEKIASVHHAYLEAGSTVVLTNTFGANELKYRGSHSLNEIIGAALRIARQTAEPHAAKVALDIGPTGKMLRPVGDLEFSRAVEVFRRTISIACQNSVVPDLIFIETMSDLRELKAAIIAAHEAAPTLPIFCTVALQEDGKLLTGGSVAAFAALMEALGVDAYGFNCGFGPDRMLRFVRELSKLSSKPIIVKPNAGMPRLVEEKTVFDVAPEEFAIEVSRLIDAGASIVGGCCGTTPQHIRAIARLAPAAPCEKQHQTKSTVVSSGSQIVQLAPYSGTIIGERINPTGKKLLRAAYLSGDTAYVLREAVKQVDAGAAILDVNCGLPGINEADLLEQTIDNVQSVVTCPIQVDTADPTALAKALRIVNGKALVNSVNGKRESMDAVFPIVRQYGGVMVGLCLDENGIPSTVEGRVAIARKLLSEGAKYGFGAADFVFDALTLSVSADPNAALVTLETVRRLTEELKVNTILGVSNVSFGLPNRAALNNAMYALAKRAGLSAAIANPSMIKDEISQSAEAALLAQDSGFERWIAENSLETTATLTTATAEMPELGASILRGLREDSERATRAALKVGEAPMSIIEHYIVPALEKVGSDFESGRVFLPQLLMAADAAGDAFAIVREYLSRHPSGDDSRAEAGAIVLATVKGDIHDIGKNIVRALLENFGFRVIDLGRDVPAEKIVDTAIANSAKLVGLSALMTTTVGAMAETIRLLRQSGCTAKTVVGGAVVTEEYARSIGADFYAKDAMRTVRIAEEIIRI